MKARTVPTVLGPYRLMAIQEKSIELKKLSPNEIYKLLRKISKIQDAVDRIEDKIFAHAEERWPGR